MPLRLSSDSRFKETAIVTTNEGGETFGILKKYDFLDLTNLRDNQVILYTVTSATAYKPHLIARDVYGNPQLYWIPLLVHNPENILRWPEAGTVLRLPSNSVVIPAL